MPRVYPPLFTVSTKISPKFLHNFSIRSQGPTIESEESERVQLSCLEPLSYGCFFIFILYDIIKLLTFFQATPYSLSVSGLCKSPHRVMPIDYKLGRTKVELRSLGYYRHLKNNSPRINAHNVDINPTKIRFLKALDLRFRFAKAKHVS